MGAGNLMLSPFNGHYHNSATRFGTMFWNWNSKKELHPVFMLKRFVASRRNVAVTLALGHKANRSVNAV
jgi:hypothetical protein